MYTNDYVDNGVLNADPMELVCLLYAKAIEKLNLALQCLDDGDIPGRAHAIAHAMEVILELQGSLNQEEGGEIAANLADLYAYSQERLCEANAQQKAEPIEEVLKLLSIVYEGWQDSRPKRMIEEVAVSAAAESSAAGGQAWTL